MFAWSKSGVGSEKQLQLGCVEQRPSDGTGGLAAQAKVHFNIVLPDASFIDSLWVLEMYTGSLTASKHSDREKKWKQDQKNPEQALD